MATAKVSPPSIDTMVLKPRGACLLVRASKRNTKAALFLLLHHHQQSFVSSPSSSSSSASSSSLFFVVLGSQFVSGAMDLLQRKAPSPMSLLLLLLCLHLCVGLCWTHSLQQAQQIFLGPIVEGIPDNEMKTLSTEDAEGSTGSSKEILAVDRGQVTESKVAESQSSPHFLESDVKQVSPNGNDNDSGDKNIQGSENEKQMVSAMPIVMVSVGFERQLLDAQLSVMDEAILGSDPNNYPTFEKTYHISIHGGDRIDESSIRDGRRWISRPFCSEMVAVLSKPWQYWNILCPKKGIFSSLKNLFTRAQNHLKNWFSSSNQKKAPTVWFGTEPLAIVKPVAPVLAYPRCTLGERMLSMVQQLVLEYRSSTSSNHQASCAGKTEEAAIKLRETLSSRLKKNLCSEIASPCEMEFCEFLQSHPKLASLMVFSKFGINPVALALSHHFDTGVCASITEVSDLRGSIHHVMKLGHHIRESLSSRDLLKKELPSGIKFWKSLFAGNQDRCKACFHQVLDNVKKLMKHQQATICQQAKCPKLVSTCSFAKEYKHLTRMLLMLKLQPWSFAARSCAAENSCSSLPNVISKSGIAHEIDKRQVHHFNRVHIVRGQMHDVPTFPAIQRQACRKAMLFRGNPMGLSPFDLRANVIYNPLELLHLEPIQMESSGPGKILDDFDTMISMVHKLHLDLPHEVLESNKHALNILDSFHGIAQHRGVEGNLIMSSNPEDFYTLMDHVLKNPSRENVQLQAAESKSSKFENPEIRSISANEASSRAEM